MSYQANRAQLAYRTTSVQTASQSKLIIMLFEGAARFMRQFIEACNQQRIEEAHTNAVKAQRIMTELIVCLDHDKGGEVAKLIETAYSNIRRRMAEANIKKDLALAELVIADLESFRDTWNEVFQKVGDGGTPPTAGLTG